MGFQDMQFDAKLRTVRCRGEFVRTSYRITARSVAHDASIDVSTWLNFTSVIVSMADGHTRLETGAPDVLDVSYIDIELDPAAKVGKER
jgi:hypothetical protein